MGYPVGPIRFLPDFVEISVGWGGYFFRRRDRRVAAHAIPEPSSSRVVGSGEDEVTLVSSGIEKRMFEKEEFWLESEMEAMPACSMGLALPSVQLLRRETGVVVGLAESSGHDSHWSK